MSKNTTRTINGKVYTVEVLPTAGRSPKVVIGGSRRLRQTSGRVHEELLPAERKKVAAAPEMDLMDILALRYGK